MNVDDVVTNVLSHRGQVVLVAGHSNTVPAMIEKLGGTIDPIPGDQFDNLYVVAVPRWFGRTKVYD